ncbi:MAG: hypothetical protein N2376_13610, partial [Clostridia bacterium]|nr:hypothetical protein [Clostridia bacterium]
MITPQDVEIRCHNPMEFLYTLFAAGTHEHYFNMIQEFNVEPVEKLTQMPKSIKNCLLYTSDAADE